MTIVDRLEIQQVDSTGRMYSSECLKFLHPIWMSRHRQGCFSKLWRKSFSSVYVFWPQVFVFAVISLKHFQFTIDHFVIMLSTFCGVSVLLNLNHQTKSSTFLEIYDLPPWKTIAMRPCSVQDSKMLLLLDPCVQCNSCNTLSEYIIYWILSFRHRFTLLFDKLAVSFPYYFRLIRNLQRTRIWRARIVQVHYSRRIGSHHHNQINSFKLPRCENHCARIPTSTQIKISSVQN